MKDSKKTLKAPKMGGDGMRKGGKPKRGSKKNALMPDMTRQMTGRGGMSY